MSILKKNNLHTAVLWCAFALYIALSTWLFASHEPWRDEAHAWQIAVAAESIQDIVTAAPYEGTPVLWHIILRGIHELGGAFVHARIVHLLFAIVAVGIVLWKAPLLWWQKAMVSFGYFFLFEFAVVARSYSLTMLLLFLLTVLWQYRDRHTAWFAILLVALAHTNIFGWVMALVLCALIVYESIELYVRSAESRQELDLRTAAASVFVAAGLLVVPWLLLPTADVSPHLTGVVGITAGSITHAAIQIMRVFVPIGSIEPQFWNNVWNPDTLHIILGVLLCVASFMICRLYHIRYRWMIAYIAMLVVSVGILSLKGIQHIRFSGLVFIFWLACIWLGKQEVIESGKKIVRGRLYTIARVMLGVILTVQILASIPAIVFESTLPFSNAVSAAQFLEENGYLASETLLSSAFTSVGTSILPHMERDTIFSPELDREVRVVLWNTAYYESVFFSPEEIVEKVDSTFEDSAHTRSVILFNDPLGSEFMGYRLEAFLINAIVPDENFYIYVREK